MKMGIYLWELKLAAFCATSKKLFVLLLELTPGLAGEGGSDCAQLHIYIYIPRVPAALSSHLLLCRTLGWSCSSTSLLFLLAWVGFGWFFVFGWVVAALCA